MRELISFGVGVVIGVLITLQYRKFSGNAATNKHLVNAEKALD